MSSHSVPLGSRGGVPHRVGIAGPWAGGGGSGHCGEGDGGVSGGAASRSPAGGEAPADPPQPGRPRRQPPRRPQFCRPPLRRGGDRGQGGAGRADCGAGSSREGMPGQGGETLLPPASMSTPLDLIWGLDRCEDSSKEKLAPTQKNFVCATGGNSPELGALDNLYRRVGGGGVDFPTFCTGFQKTFQNGRPASAVGGKPHWRDNYSGGKARPGPTGARAQRDGAAAAARSPARLGRATRHRCAASEAAWWGRWRGGGEGPSSGGP